MNIAELQVKIRPMVFLDLHTIFSIDEQIRASAKVSMTYKDFTTRQIFGIGTEESNSEKRPNILEVAKLVDLGFVAEAKGTMLGFVVGRQTYLAEREIQEGEIAIFGVHPDYRGKGIATKLINALCDLFRSRGVHRVRIEIDPRDEDLIAFVERSGFTGHHLLQYTKTL